MLDAEQIRATIVQRMVVANASCNSHHLDCIEAQLRALVFVLGDGERPPVFRGDVKAVCDAAGIPVICHEDGTVEWPDDWLRDHGFEIRGDDVHHPRLGVAW